MRNETGLLLIFGTLQQIESFMAGGVIPVGLLTRGEELLERETSLSHNFDPELTYRTVHLLDDQKIFDR